MNTITNLITITLLTLLTTACTQHPSTLNKSNIRAINKELNDSLLQGDITVLEKYFYEGTEIFIDLDPDPNQGSEQISLKEFRQLALISIGLIDNMEITEDIISIEIDNKNDQATMVVNSQITTSMMDMKIFEESVSTMLFGLINGEIKILKTSDELITITME